MFKKTLKFCSCTRLRMHVGIQMGEQEVHTTPPPPLVFYLLMHGVVSLADTTSYDNVLFAGVGIVV